MAILKVARLGHPVLRQEAGKVAARQVKKPEMRGLIGDMIETMREYVGVGLAAPQVHVSVRVFVMQIDPDDESTLYVAVNPVVTPLGEEEKEEWEGCLSVPDMHGRVSRPLRVRLDALDEEGRAYSVEFEDFAARVCQHEADHLDGVVFLDRMDNLSTLTFGDEYRRHWAPKEEEKKEGGEKN